MKVKKYEVVPTPVVVVRAPKRLKEIYEHIGYRVRLIIDRKNGSDLSPDDQLTVRAVVAGYEVDEHGPAVPASEDPDFLSGMEEIAKKEDREKRAKKAAEKAPKARSTTAKAKTPTPKKTTKTKTASAAKSTGKKTTAPPAAKRSRKARTPKSAP